MSVDTADLEVIAEQLGREPRGVVDISYRSPDGTPGVVKTKPRLDDGTPFPTLFYLTDPRLTAEASRLETTGVMKEMTARLESDEELAADYHRADGALQAVDKIADSTNGVRPVLRIAKPTIKQPGCPPDEKRHQDIPSRKNDMKSMKLDKTARMQQTLTSRRETSDVPQGAV